MQVPFTVKTQQQLFSCVQHLSGHTEPGPCLGFPQHLDDLSTTDTGLYLSFLERVYTYLSVNCTFRDQRFHLPIVFAQSRFSRLLLLQPTFWLVCHHLDTIVKPPIGYWVLLPKGMLHNTLWRFHRPWPYKAVGKRLWRTPSFQATARPVWSGYDGWCNGHWWSVISSKRAKEKEVERMGGE